MHSQNLWSLIHSPPRRRFILSIMSSVKPSQMLPNKVVFPLFCTLAGESALWGNGLLTYFYFLSIKSAVSTIHSDGTQWALSVYSTELNGRPHWSILFCTESNSIVQQKQNKQNIPHRQPHQPLSFQIMLDPAWDSSSQIKLYLIHLSVLQTKQLFPRYSKTNDSLNLYENWSEQKDRSSINSPTSYTIEAWGFPISLKNLESSCIRLGGGSVGLRRRVTGNQEGKQIAGFRVKWSGKIQNTQLNLHFRLTTHSLVCKYVSNIAWNILIQKFFILLLKLQFNYHVLLYLYNLAILIWEPMPHGQNNNSNSNSNNNK